MCIIERLQHQFLDESGYAAIADHAQGDRLLPGCAATFRHRNVEPDAAVFFLDGIGGQTPANRGAGRSAIGQEKAAVVLGAFDDVILHQAVGEVSVAMGTHAIGGVELAPGIADDGIGLAPVIEADHIRRTQIRRHTDFDPTIRIRHCVLAVSFDADAGFGIR